MLGFSLNDLPKNVVITSAILSLYHSSGSFWDPLTFGYESNEVLIQRTTSSWDEATVTWADQPSITTKNQVIIPNSTFVNQNFPSIDITKLAKDVLADNSTNLDMMLSSKLKTHYRMKSFATSNHDSVQLCPMLKVCVINDVINPISNTEHTKISSIFPNPANNHIKVLAEDLKKVVINDLSGNIIKTIDASNSGVQIDVSELSVGIYLIKVQANSKVEIHKLIIE